MAGLAAEGLKYDKVVGQSADLFTLQVCAACWFTHNLVTLTFGFSDVYHGISMIVSCDAVSSNLDILD